MVEKVGTNRRGGERRRKVVDHALSLPHALHVGTQTLLLDEVSKEAVEKDML